MTLSKKQKEDAQPWNTHLCLWERDLLYMAGQFEGWLDIAVDAGFSIEKIIKPWTHKDAGRLVKVMTVKEYQSVHEVLDFERRMRERKKFEKWADEFSTKWGFPYLGLLQLAGYS